MSGTSIGSELHELVRELYPIFRSITGERVRETLTILRRHLPLVVHDVPTGTPVLDWVVPKEWKVREAYVEDPLGRRVVDVAAGNLHLVSYSVPVRARLSLAELRSHLFTLPDRPTLVPYRTSYWHESWGFCLSQETADHLEEGEYVVCIDSELHDGYLTYGECLIPGDRPEEVLLSTHVCHPSMANYNSSGMATLALLGRHLLALPRRRWS